MKLIFLAAIAVFMVSAGCQNTAEGMKQDAAINQREATKAAENAGAQITEAGQDAQAALTLTPTIKAAIMEDAALKPHAGEIDVDSNDQSVTINGTVPTAELKEKVSRIAAKVIEEQGKGQVLLNELKVKS